MILKQGFIITRQEQENLGMSMHLLKEYNNKYNKNNVLWICESKNILSEQFNKNILEKRQFNEIIDNFNIYNFVEKK